MTAHSRISRTSIASQLILTDWAANLESIAANPNALFWELVLHCLLYDKVLIQDEALAQSKRLARWFGAPGTRWFLEELVDTGAIQVLVQNAKGYPDPLRDLATMSPIAARSQYIVRHGAKQGVEFAPSKTQERFHAHIDGILRTRPSQIRSRKAGADLHQLFQGKMLEALDDEDCTAWITRGGIDTRHRDELRSLIENPAGIADRARRSGVPLQLDPRFGDDPRFTRTLGHALAATYPEHSQPINAMVHSAFAAVICETEEYAAGRYTPALRELWLSKDQPFVHERQDSIPIVRVERALRVPLDLPPLAPGIGKVIAETRNSPAGRLLRSARTQYGSDITFGAHVDRWRAVAEELAKRITRKSGNSLGAIVAQSAGSAGKGAIGALITGPWADGLEAQSLNVLEAVATGAIIRGALSIGQLGIRMIRAAGASHKLAEQIAETVQLRCSDLPRRRTS